MNDMTIGKLAERVGVGVETIRFYERQGLLEQPPKPERGFRIYPPDAVDRVRFIRQAQELGFSLTDARELLDLRTDPMADCSDVQRRATAKLDDVRAKIERLRLIENALERVVAACPGQGNLDCCSIMTAMEAQEPTIERRRDD